MGWFGIALWRPASVLSLPPLRRYTRKYPTLIETLKDAYYEIGRNGVYA